MLIHLLRMYLSTNTLVSVGLGPKDVTINDTWRMIWETNSNRIVMVTNKIEAGKVQYKIQRCFVLCFMTFTMQEMFLLVFVTIYVQSWVLLKAGRTRTHYNGGEILVTHAPYIFMEIIA